MRLRHYEATKNACFVPKPPKVPRGGAKYRKQWRMLTYTICSVPPK